jgi:uncharacterized protein YecT (DUF1311 family)
VGKFWNGILLLAILSMPSQVRAQNSGTAIDKKLDACLDREITTEPKNDCLQIAYSSWDQVLTQTYQQLLGRLSPDAQQTLRSSQREWFLYRDTQFKFIDKVQTLLQGTMFYTVTQSSRKTIAKDRARQLQAYANLGARCPEEQSSKANWDKKLNIAYGQLRSALDTKGQELLKTAEFQWIRYRDQELKFVNKLYKNQNTPACPLTLAEQRIARIHTTHLAYFLELLAGGSR